MVFPCNMLLDFNWDFEKNKPKHKSYISLENAIALIEKEK